MDDCSCKCHLEHIAEMEPFCTRCDNSYANLCTAPPVIYVSRETYDALIEELEKPPQEIPGLADLLKRRPNLWRGMS